MPAIHELTDWLAVAIDLSPLKQVVAYPSTFVAPVFVTRNLELIPSLHAKLEAA